MANVTKPIVLDETFAAKMDAVIAAMTKTYYTLTVTAQTKDGVTVTGQVVTVREGGKDGVVFATEAYEGQPVSFSLPQGFHYYVEISNTLAHHFGPTYAEGIINGTDRSIVLYYGDLAHIQSATDIKGALDAGEDLSGLLGESITCSRGNDTLTWDVVDVRDDEVVLLLHDTMPEQMQFDKPQALAWFESGLPAGDYSFQNGNTYYYFTLTEAIPAGGQLRANTTVFETYPAPDSVESVETGSVSTTAISGATHLGKCGENAGTYAYSLNHIDRVNNGSNNFAESPLLQWLNSDAAANTVMPQITKLSRPYSVAFAGFMSGLDADFVAAIADTVWKCATNTTYECPAEYGGLTVKGQRYTVTAKFGLASEKEIFGTQTGTSVEAGDHVWQLYADATAADRIKRYGTGARNWWLRSPHSHAYYERSVHSSGTVSNYNASSTYGVVPACKIRKSV